jgi:uncharacterized protein YprB with RNaseH-like and TPR domain
MLTSTFCHIPGVGEKIERSLWSAGVLSWEVAVQNASIRLPRSLQDSWTPHLRASIENYEKRNIDYFVENLPSNQHWRVYRDFRDSCAFVDIETTGLLGWDEITTIALYDGKTIRYYVNGQNLDRFPADVMDYQLLVTYNGKCFDVPFIEGCFRIRLPHAHIDLRHPLRSLGLVGGLKGCEQQLGIGRPGLEGLDGSMAVSLWNEYRTRNNHKALETLLAYNIQDTLSLHALMVHTHNEKVKATPFAATHLLPLPSLPEPPVQADPEIVKRYLHRYFP